MRSQAVTLEGGDIIRRRRIPPGQTRCACGKQAYTGRKDAAAAAATERRMTGEPIYAYRCDRGGHCWHIGHNCTTGGHVADRIHPDDGTPTCWCGRT